MNMEHYLQALKVIEAYAAAAQPQFTCFTRTKVQILTPNYGL